MDNTQLKAIATGVLSTGHWPAHLGLHTDAEKIEWLARRLEELAVAAESVEQLQDEIDKLTDEVGELTDDVTELGKIQACDKCDLCEDHIA